MFPKNFDEAVKTGFLPYMLEANGNYNLCNTRTAAINSIIKDFKYIISSGENPNDYIDEVFNRHNLTIDSLSPEELEKINNLY